MHRIDIDMFLILFLFIYPVLSQLCTVNVNSTLALLYGYVQTASFSISCCQNNATDICTSPVSPFECLSTQHLHESYSGVYCSALIDDEINFDWSRAEVKPDEILISCCQKYFLDSVLVLNEQAAMCNMCSFDSITSDKFIGKLGIIYFFTKVSYAGSSPRFTLSANSWVMLIR